jgi:lysophospholipase L1-like esterase
MQSAPILFIGDSLTEWFDLHAYFPDIKIINEGIAGDTTYGLLERLERTIEKPAGKIFLMIGINDVFNEFNKDDIVENLQLIIEEIQTSSEEVPLIVQSLLPVNESMLGSSGYLNKVVRYINKRLKAHCDARSLQYLDLYPDFLSGDEMKREYTTDGGHLSPAGYALWAKKIQALL